MHENEQVRRNGWRVVGRGIRKVCGNGPGAGYWKWCGKEGLH